VSFFRNCVVRTTRSGARRLQRLVIRSQFQAALRRQIQGLPVAVVADDPEIDAAFDRIASGLELLSCYGPTILARLRRDAQGIIVWEITAGAPAEWHRAVKLIVVDPRFLCDPEATPAAIAATLVHEATCPTRSVWLRSGRSRKD
jgi:hypothetical protein